MKTRHAVKYFEFLEKFKSEIQNQIRNDQSRKFGDDAYRGNNLLVGNNLIHIINSDVFWRGDGDEWDEVVYESYNLQKLKADIVAKYYGDGVAYEPSTEDLLAYFCGDYDIYHDRFDEDVEP